MLKIRKIRKLVKHIVFTLKSLRSVLRERSSMGSFLTFSRNLWGLVRWRLGYRSHGNPGNCRVLVLGSMAPGLFVLIFLQVTINPLLSTLGWLLSRGARIGLRQPTFLFDSRWLFGFCNSRFSRCLYRCKGCEGVRISIYYGNIGISSMIGEVASQSANGSSRW